MLSPTTGTPLSIRDLEEVTEERSTTTTEESVAKAMNTQEDYTLGNAHRTGPKRIGRADLFEGGLISLTHWCSRYSQCGSTWRSTSSNGGVESRKTLQIVLTFTYSRVPKYLVDYTTCDEKRALESFSFSFMLLPTATLDTIGHCSSAQKSTMDTLGPAKSARLLTGKFHLGNALLYSGRDGFLTDDDLTNSLVSSYSRLPSPQASPSTMLSARTDIWFLNETIIEIPEGSSNISMLFQVQYDSKLMDVYVALRQENNFPGFGGPMIGVTPIATAVGAPVWFNNKFDATSTLSVSPYITKYNPYLQPGRYFLEMKVHFTDPNWGQGRTEFCAPISLIYGDKYATSETSAPATPPMPTAAPAPGEKITTTTPAQTTAPTPAPDFSKPTIIDFNPSSLNGIDPSETLTITVTLNKPATKEFLKSSKRTGSSSKMFAWLEVDADGVHDDTNTATAAGKGSNEGTILYPDSVYFIDSTHVAASWWHGRLEWQTGYRLYVDGTTIGRDVDVKQTYDDSAISHLSTSYITGYCSCSRAGTCVGGGGCGCTEPNGETCSACDWQHTLSTTKGPVLGTGIFTKFCLREGQTLQQLLDERNQKMSISTVAAAVTSSPKSTTSPPKVPPTLGTDQPHTNSPTTATKDNNTPPTSNNGSVMKTIGFVGVLCMFVFGGAYWFQYGARRIRGGANGSPIAFNSRDGTRSAYHQEHHNHDVFTLGSDDGSDDLDDPASRKRLTTADGKASALSDEDENEDDPFAPRRSSTAVEMKAVKRLATGISATSSSSHHVVPIPSPVVGVSSLTPSQASTGTVAPAATPSKKTTSTITSPPAAASQQSTDFFADLDNEDFFASSSPPPITPPIAPPAAKSPSPQPSPTKD